jgi:hypothetical protein
MMQQTGPVPTHSAPAVSPILDQDRPEETLRRAHVHVSRYYRTWLREEADGEALAEALAAEALMRIARMPAPPKGCDDREVVASWLAVARDVALEATGG